MFKVIDFHTTSLRSTAALLLWLSSARGFLRLLHLLHNVDEDLGDVDVLLGRRLDESAAELLGELLAFLSCDVPLLDIALVANQDHWNVVLLLDPQNLRPELIAVIKRSR